MIKLQNIILTREYNLNLILFGQIRKTKITYCNDFSSDMTLIKSEKFIIYVKKPYFFHLKPCNTRKRYSIKKKR